MWSLRDPELSCSASDRQGSNFESFVWGTVSSHSYHHPREVLLAQLSLCAQRWAKTSFISFSFAIFYSKPRGRSSDLDDVYYSLNIRTCQLYCQTHVEKVPTSKQVHFKSRHLFKTLQCLYYNDQKCSCANVHRIMEF